MSVPMQEIFNQKSKLTSVDHAAIVDDKMIQAVIDVVIRQAAGQSYSAGMNGERSDGGASRTIHQLQGFIDGVIYGKTQDFVGTFSQVHKQLVLDEDPRYQQYLELKKEFEGK